MLAIIRGAGDIATAIALRLWRCGILVVMTEIEQPLTVRRTVAFSEAVRLGQMQVEGVLAVRVQDVRQVREVHERKHAIPVLVDPECHCIELKPDVVVDAILAKRNLGTTMDMAPVVVGVRANAFCALQRMVCFAVFARLVIMSKRGKSLLMWETFLWWLCLRGFCGA